jgi:hypothetical protein
MHKKSAYKIFTSFLCHIENYCLGNLRFLFSKYFFNCSKFMPSGGVTLLINQNAAS